MNDMTFRQICKRFFEPVRAHPKIYIKSILPYSLRATAPILIVIILEQLTKAVETGDKDIFGYYLRVFIILTILYHIIGFLTRKRGWVEIRTLGFKKLYPKYITSFLQFDNTSVEKIGTGRIMSIMQQGFTSWIKLIEKLFRDGIAVIISLIFICYTMIQIGLEYFIGFIIVIIIVQIIINKFSLKIKENKYKEAGIKSEWSRALIRIIMSKFEIQQQNKHEEETQKLNNIIDSMHTNILARINHVHFIFFLPEFIASGLSFIVFITIGYGVFNNEFSFSTLVLFAGVLTLLNGMIAKSTYFIKDFMHEFGVIEKFRDTFNTIPSMKGYNTGKEFIYKKGNINLEKISFGYDNHKVFDNFSLKIKGGTKTAFVGESGGGKTTLIKLLAGYINSDQGEIVVDGQKLSSIKLAEYYKHIGYLTQEPSVFDGTIYENLIYALDYIPSPQEIEKIIQLAKCEFINDFKKGIQTEIGERGVRLSGGQKQRIAIAKIMLKNPNIILLDEPTSALDSFNEEKVNSALHNLFKGKTVIIVAHRLQTVKEADQIFFLEKGKIIEEGTHTELVKKKGKYKRMLDLQSGF